MPPRSKLSKKRRITNNNQEVLCRIEVDRDQVDVFLSNLQQLYQSKQFTDLILQVRSTQFPVHRVVLASGHHYLSALLCSGMKESEQEIITIDEDPTLFKYILGIMIKNFCPINILIIFYSFIAAQTISMDYRYSYTRQRLSLLWA